MSARREVVGGEKEVDVGEKDGEEEEEQNTATRTMLVSIVD